MTDYIYTDRSRIECYEKCPRKRFWQYEFDGRGLEKDELKLDARIGNAVHQGIERGLSENIPAAEIALEAREEFIKQCHQAVETAGQEQLEHDIIEGGILVCALVYSWLRVRAPRLLEEGEVLLIEKEMQIDFHMPGGIVVRFMARPDIVWRRRSDGTVFIRNLKTVRDPSTTWREQWALDMQTLSEPLAVDTFYGQPNFCGGVIIDGLITGKVTRSDKQLGGLYHHNSPLVNIWRRERADGSLAHSHEYKYSWEKTSSAFYPGGIIAWIDHLLSDDPAVVWEQLIELPPIIRSPYQIERWKRQVLQREAEIHSQAQHVNLNRESSLDGPFPMHTAAGNCLRPGKCSCYELCHGASASDPLRAGFRYRTPNHPQEGECDG
jgi:hypothetical protein